MSASFATLREVSHLPAVAFVEPGLELREGVGFGGRGNPDEGEPQSTRLGLELSFDPPW